MVSQRDDDLRMLATLLDDHLEELSEAEVEAFADMRFNMTAYEKVGGQDHRRQLSAKQRQWVTSVHERLVPQYANLVSRGLVPRGREVPTPPVLQNLPKKPPPRRRDDE